MFSLDSLLQNWRFHATWQPSKILKSPVLIGSWLAGTWVSHPLAWGAGLPVVKTAKKF